MLLTDYQPPVAKLLELGDPREIKQPIAYLTLGLSAADVPELCRLVRAGAHRNSETDEIEAYGSLHAWFALQALRAADAVDTLVGEYHFADDDDWVTEEMPAVMAQIGAAAIPANAAYLAYTSHGIWGRGNAASALAAIAKAHPETRESCVGILTRTLANFAEQDPDLNAMVIGELMTLKALESAPLMQQAFAADAVELSFAGDWEDVQIELGLLEQRLTPKSDYRRFGNLFDMRRENRLHSENKQKAAKAKKSKRKQQAKARQRNRKNK